MSRSLDDLRRLAAAWAEFPDGYDDQRKEMAVKFLELSAPAEEVPAEVVQCFHKAIQYLEEAHEPKGSGVDMRTAWDTCLDADLPRFKKALDNTRRGPSTPQEQP